MNKNQVIERKEKIAIDQSFTIIKLYLILKIIYKNIKTKLVYYLISHFQ